MKTLSPPSPHARRQSLGAFAAATVLTGALSVSAAAPGQAAETFKVIVNARTAGGALHKNALADIYLGRVKRWRDGRPIAPVDQPSTSPLRGAFTTSVLRMTQPAIRAHWMQRLSAGERPPVARPTDAEVIAYVARDPGAIGYVALETPLPETVKAVILEDGAGVANGSAATPGRAAGQ